MSSLIQIFLRPKCRTIKGFCELIVREWIIRGHKFRERVGQVHFDIHSNPSQEVRFSVQTFSKIFLKKILVTRFSSLSRLCSSINSSKSSFI